MSKIFRSGKKYSGEQLDFYIDLDNYEKKTNYLLTSYDTRTLSAVHRRRLGKDSRPNLLLYEVTYHCVKGRKKNTPKDSKKKYCLVELIVRMNLEENKFVIREWKHEHNHKPSKDTKSKLSWEEKFLKRMREGTKKNKNNKNNQTLEEKTIDCFLKILRENLIKSSDTLKMKLELLKDYGQKITELDEQEKLLHEENGYEKDEVLEKKNKSKKVNEKLEKIKIKEPTEIQDDNEVTKKVKKYIPIIDNRIIDRSFKIVSQKRTQEEEANNNNKENKKIKIERNKDDNEEGINIQEKLSIDNMENNDLKQKLLEKLIGKETTKKCDMGHIIEMKDLNKIDQTLLEFLLENVTLMSQLEKFMKPEVVKFLNKKLIDEAM
ncbi:hypothetical protein KQX54_016294 [Cotesia glomerata]|uniref:ZSWIM3 N-terminal domain-containing protein n=1 Tax=Cotesia glomerata TaxID=32391 RepID=A0AAV7HY23_COTGL|nr:hypothetical protein KQX54_016294 [Cotesia glomerata]